MFNENVQVQNFLVNLLSFLPFLSLFFFLVPRLSNYEQKVIVFSDESNYTVINRKDKVIVGTHYNEKFHSRFLTPRLQIGEILGRHLG